MISSADMSGNRFLQSAPLLLPATAFVAGVVFGDRFVENMMWWIVLMGTLCLAIVFHHHAEIQSVFILICFVALGAVRASTVRKQHNQIIWPDGYVRYEAVIVSETTEKPKTYSMDMLIANSDKKLKCYLEKNERSQQLAIGDRVQICSHIERNSNWRQGTFDFCRYLEVHDFSGQTFVRSADWKLLPPSWQGLSFWQQAKLRFLCYRHQLLQRFKQSGIEAEQYAVIAAMTLGDKSAMTRELKDVYAVSGASHILALSGLHLSIIYMLLSLLLVGRRFRFFLQTIIVLGIWAFALLVGLPASIVRSAVMISVYGLLSLANRNRMSVNALALTALLILMISPDSLFDIGFQLSFAAMSAILLLQPHLSNLVRRDFLMDHPVVRWLWGLTTISVAAQVGTAPLVAYYFGRFSTLFLFTNYVVIPATTIILYLAFASLLIPVIAVILVRVISWLNAFLSGIASLPYSSIDGLCPSALQTAMVYIIIFSFFLIVFRYDKFR